MLATPPWWAEARSGLYRMQTCVEINNVDYDEEDIISVSTRASLYGSGTASVGGCVAKEIDLVIKPKGVIPRMAEIRVYTRPISADGTWAPAWLLKGVYFIDTRQTDRVTGIMTIHGYDAMLKSEQVYMDDPPGWDWPMDMDAVCHHIADRMGVIIDDRTEINAQYDVEYPNDMTMREILSAVAVAHAGNWIITDEDKLRLVPLYNTAIDEPGGGDDVELVLQEKVAVPDSVDVVVEADEGYDALAKVIVEAASNLKPWHIRKGVTMFGVTGDMEVEE